MASDKNPFDKLNVSPEIARALLDANPDLRKEGLSTNLVLDEANKQARPADEKEAAKGPVLAEIKMLKQQLAKAVSRRDAEVARARADFDSVRSQILEKLSRLLASADDVTQQKAQQTEAEFLTAVGYKKK